MNYLEMLAALGVGSAHPGGFSATLEQLKHHPLPPGSRVLEVGCGTGRTACHLAKLGHDVTGIDILSGMVAKAQRRAEQEQVNVRFLQGDIRSLPLPDASFDAVLAESVTVFSDLSGALREYLRVLKPGGVLYDREMMALQAPTSEVRSAVKDFYGVQELLSPEQWVDLAGRCGFEQPEVWNLSAFPENMWEDQIRYPDPLQQPDPDALMDPRIWELTFRYDDIMTRYGDYFGYGVLIGKKKSRTG